MRGFHKKQSIHKSLLRVGTNSIDIKQTTSRLCPINRAPKGQSLYDTIAFFIFCPKHKCIAVCNTYHSNREIAVWLQFIYLSNKVNYNFAIEDGLCLILSDYDCNLLFKYKEGIPFHTKIFDAIETFILKKNQSITRFNCLATLHNNTPGFECCRKTSRIHWISIEDVCMNGHDHFWGPQVYDICINLKENSNQIEFELTFTEEPLLFRVNNYYQDYTVITRFERTLNSLGITRKQIDLLFNDFFEHCFPGFAMTFHSFADYLCKYGFRETNTKMRRLFNAFKTFKSFNPYCTWDHLSFDGLLVGLAHIDKECPQDEWRLLFVPDYYDKNRDYFLSEDEFREIVTDIHKNEGQEEIDRIVADGMTGNQSPNGMNWSEFYNRATIHDFGNATHLSKCDQNILNIIYKDIKAKTTRPMDTLLKYFI